MRNIVGFLDLATSTVAGWVMDTNAPDSPLDVGIVINGVERLRLTASSLRVDVGIVYNTSGRHGFSISVESLINFGENKIEVFECTGREFLSPGTINFLYRGSAEKVLVGREGFLFLQNDANFVIEQMEGDRRFSKSDVDEFFLDLRMRKERFGELGATFDCVIVPEKYAVLARYLDGISLSEGRTARILEAEALDRGETSLLYPIDLLIDSFGKRLDLAFPKGDTHLSPRARYTLCKWIIEKWPEMVPFPELSDRQIISRESVGDLGGKLKPPRMEILEDYLVDLHGVEINDSVAVALNQGSSPTSLTFRSRNPLAANQKCIFVAGTSSAYYCLPLLAERFGEVIFTWANSIDIDMIKAYRPSRIVALITERTLAPKTDDLNFQAAHSFHNKA